MSILNEEQKSRGQVQKVVSRDQDIPRFPTALGYLSRAEVHVPASCLKQGRGQQHGITGPQPRGHPRAGRCTPSLRDGPAGGPRRCGSAGR